MTATTYPRAHPAWASPDNVGGELVPGDVRFFVVHVAQSPDAPGVISWFRNPAAQVSAHFLVDRDGAVYQMVPLDRMAWAEMDFNNRAISIEHVGYTGQRLTKRQLRASLELLIWLHRQFPQVPLHRTANPNGVGVITHAELGVLGGDHPDCPGWPIHAQFNIGLRPRLMAPLERRLVATKKTPLLLNLLTHPLRKA